MTYAIIGSGNLGTALARQFARNGISVCIANTSGPETLADLARELGDSVTPTTLRNALDADVLILAIPFRAHTKIASAMANWNGRIVIDAMNARDLTPEELDGRESTELVALALPGAKVVKTFNQLPANLLGSDPSQDGGRRVMFVSSDDVGASTVISRLVEQLGFAPIQLGKLNKGGALLRFRGPLILQNLIKHS